MEYDYETILDLAMQLKKITPGKLLVDCVLEAKAAEEELKNEE